MKNYKEENRLLSDAIYTMILNNLDDVIRIK